MFFCLPVTSPLVLARVWFHVTTDLFCKIPMLTNAQWLLELMDLKCLYFHSSCLYWLISVATNSMGLWNLVHAGRCCLRNPYFPWHCSVSVLCRMPYIPFSHPSCVLLGCFDSVPYAALGYSFWDSVFQVIWKILGRKSLSKFAFSSTTIYSDSLQQLNIFPFLNM